MNLQVLLVLLHSKEVRVSLDGDDRLAVDGPRAAMTPALIDLVRTNKPALLAVLRTPRREWKEGWGAVLEVCNGSSEASDASDDSVTPEEKEDSRAGLSDALERLGRHGRPESQSSEAPPSLLEVMDPADPLRPAHGAYREAVHDVRVAHDRVKATVGQDPPALEPAVEDRLDTAIQAAFDAGDPDEAVRRIEAWRAAWLAILAPCAAHREPVQVLVTTARRLDAHQLLDLVHDSDVPEENREVYRAEVQRRAQEMVDEAEGRRFHWNQGVHDMFTRGGGYSGCRGHRHWRSTTGVVICGVCHPPAAPYLVAEWIEPARGQKEVNR